MYCAEDLSQFDGANWLLASCGLSGGSSGGPWMQPFSNGNGSLISVNSWGYTNQPGMYGPKLSRYVRVLRVQCREAKTPTSRPPSTATRVRRHQPAPERAAGASAR